MLKSLVFAALATSFAAHGASLSLKISQTPENQLKYTLTGKELCDTDVVKIRAVETNPSTAPFYKLKNGKDKFEVSKTGGECKIDLNIPGDVAGANKILEVAMVHYNGIKDPTSTSQFLRIPCLRNLESASKRDGSFAFSAVWPRSLVCANEDKMTPIGVTPTPAPLMPDQGIQSPNPISQDPNGPKKEEQSCQANANIDTQDRGMLNVSVACRQADTVEVWITSGNTILLHEERVQVPAGQGTHLKTFRRQPDRSMRFDVSLTTSKGEKFEAKNKTILKDPSFNYPVTAHITSGTEVTPEAQDKALGRGKFWRSEIKVEANDQDIEQDFPQKEIIVKLINEKGEAIHSDRISTGEAANFTVEAQFITPGRLEFWSKNHWDTGADLHNGLNTLKVRIYDAFQSEKYIEVGPIHIQVNGDGMK